MLKNINLKKILNLQLISLKKVQNNRKYTKFLKIHTVNLLEKEIFIIFLKKFIFFF